MLYMTQLSRPAEDALSVFKHHQALAFLHTRKAEAAMKSFLDVVAYGSTVEGQPIARAPQCVRTWTKWLQDNGPNTRQHITEATGVKFTERGTPFTIKWEDVAPEDAHSDIVPANTIVRFRSSSAGRGRGAAPVIFALWSQRYDVLPLFGVGPHPVKTTTIDGIPVAWDETGQYNVSVEVHGEPVHGESRAVEGPVEVVVDSLTDLQADLLRATDPRPMTGVIRPPDDLTDDQWADAIRSGDWVEQTIVDLEEPEAPTIGADKPSTSSEEPPK